jgi:hypothetical protein
MDDGNCPVCGQVAKNRGCIDTKSPTDPLQHRWDCQTCGQFRIGDRANIYLQYPDHSGQRFLLSAYLREGSDVLVDEDLLSRLGRGALRERTVPEKTELILRWFADKSPEYGSEVVHEPQRDYPMAWCRSSGEWKRIVDMLVREREHLRTASSGSICTVTDKGWNWLALKPREESVATAFVAMNFASEYQDLGERSRKESPTRDIAQSSSAMTSTPAASWTECWPESARHVS